MATFRRSKDGDWVVQGSPDEVKVGRVLVEKKDGSKKYVNVAEVGRPFKNDRTGTMMVYGYIKPREEKPEPSSPEPQVSAQASFEYGETVPEDSPF